MYSDKQGVLTLIETLVSKGLRKVVISPGSRNAPLSLSFYHHPAIEVLVIPDERSAGYFALGMAQQLNEPVAMVCTSGTAALNYAPSIAEAYYQKIPLIAITADRPQAWIDQADGQTIRQRNLFYNYVRDSYEIKGDSSTNEELWYIRRTVAKAWDETTLHGGGPVHINVPLNEPLYGRTQKSEPVRAIETLPYEKKLTNASLQKLAEVWNQLPNKLILSGLHKPSSSLEKILNKLAEEKSVAVLTETTSNLNSALFNPCIDRVITTISPDEAGEFRPDLLITFGGPVTSKKIKSFLRNNPPAEHWHIDPDELHTDTYQHLTTNISVSPENFFNEIAPLIKSRESHFSLTWKNRDHKTDSLHNEFIKNAEWSDLKAFESIMEIIPGDHILQLANSTPVRYAQLFKTKNPILTFSNRGTSGIDGCTSTAAGAAYATGKAVTLITGDMGFFYDSNALWNKYLRNDFRIILVNNSGGGIFRIIEGPKNKSEIEDLFETRHQQSAEYICKAFGLDYYRSSNEKELKNELKKFYSDKNDKPAVLEIFTDAEMNPKVLREYFDYLKQLEN
jgi:2-succinyl-5-enolpyruvyl-6-hydroxy-3-cyclohexene-1-carboxylate synthase